MAYIDCNDKTQRKAISDFVHDLCGLPYTRFEIDRDDLRKIEAVMERQEEIIEEQEERIAIMEEGGWHDAEKDPPKKSGKYFVFDENEDILKLEYDECIDDERWGFWEEYFDMETLGSMGSDWKPYPLKVLYWMIMPEPPKEG